MTPSQCGRACAKYSINPQTNTKPAAGSDPLGFRRHVDFRTEVPPPDLVPFIEHFWIISWEATLDSYGSEEVMHRPYVDIFISTQESGIQGHL
ncbi:hypothetical protein N8D56_05950 [Devosia sp. A8/3-2]|nr:hypothetical protein N8D56_05950 [Devosia sp. A8/3-2]